MAVNRAKRANQLATLHRQVATLQAAVRKDLAQWQEHTRSVRRHRKDAESAAWDALAGGRVTWRKTLELWGADDEQSPYRTEEYHLKAAKSYQRQAHALAASMGANAKQVEELRARIALLERPTVWEWLRELLWPVDIYLSCRLAKRTKRA